MDLDLHDKIIQQFKLQQQWTQNLCVPHGCCSIDLKCACGPTACTPSNAIQQPTDYPRRTVYRFDKKFQNLTSKSSICQLIEDCTPGAKYIHVRGQNSSNRIELKCSCYITTESLEKKKEFEKDEYKQSNTKVVTVKRQKTSGQLLSLDRMSSRKNQNALKMATIQPKSSSKRMTTSTKAPSKDDRCSSAIVLFLGVDNFWYLDSKATNLQHYGHVQDLTPKRMGMNDIDDTQSTFIQKLSSSGFAPSQITKLFNIMEEANEHEIDNKTVSNLLQRVDLLNHGDMNVDHNMSSAEKAIHYLSRLVFLITLLHEFLFCPSIESQSLLSFSSNKISHSVVYDDPQLGLSAMSNPRGRPNGKHKVVQLKADERILSEVKELREEMSFDSDKKLVLIVSFATDDMIRETMKFPEVHFIDCTSRVNRQKRDLFLSVIRSPLGRCHVSNISIMPSGKSMHT